VKERPTTVYVILPAEWMRAYSVLLRLLTAATFDLLQVIVGIARQLDSVSKTMWNMVRQALTPPDIARHPNVQAYCCPSGFNMLARIMHHAALFSLRLPHSRASSFRPTGTV